MRRLWTRRRCTPESGPAWAWRIAHLINRTRWGCWTDLVCWAIDRHLPRSRRDRTLRAALGTTACRQDAATSRDGGCYCGKFRRAGSESAACWLDQPDGPPKAWQVIRPRQGGL